MKKTIKLIDNHLEEVILIVMLSLMSIIICYQVFMRYIMNDSQSWTEEITRYLFIWMVYIGISYGVKKQKHVCVEAFSNLFSNLKQKYISILSDIIFLVFVVIVIVSSLDMVSSMAATGQTSPGMNIPMIYVYCAPCIGFILVVLRLIQNIIMTAKEIKKEVI